MLCERRSTVNRWTGSRHLLTSSSRELNSSSSNKAPITSKIKHAIKLAIKLKVIAATLQHLLLVVAAIIF